MNENKTRIFAEQEDKWEDQKAQAEWIVKYSVEEEHILIQSYFFPVYCMSESDGYWLHGWAGGTWDDDVREHYNNNQRVVSKVFWNVFNWILIVIIRLIDLLLVYLILLFRSWIYVFLHILIFFIPSFCILGRGLCGQHEWNGIKRLKTETLIFLNIECVVWVFVLVWLLNEAH